MNDEFTGATVRSIRKKHKLSRKELAELLSVSPVSIEKWEQAGPKPIRAKYGHLLRKISKWGAAGVVFGAFGAAGLIAPSAILSGGALLGGLISDKELDQATRLIEGLKKLTPEERETFIALSKKISE